jgi:hypothetical protein
MSQNPFLKSNKQKESNNRFSSLQHDDKSSFKESSNKSNRKNIEYEASQNSFKQSSKPQQNRDQDSDSRFNRRDDRFTKPKPREPSPPKRPDANDINLFPELIPIKEYSTTSKVEAITKFKDILKNVIKEEKPKENPIPPGLVRLSLINRQIVIEHGPPTPWMIKQQQKEELQKQLEDDPNYIMFQAIEAMKKNWERYEKDYDELHEEGAYAERFRLSPVYGPEYDTESEDDIEEKEEEEDEF